MHFEPSIDELRIAITTLDNTTEGTVGCHLYAVLYDHNIGDQDITHGIKCAQREGCLKCVQLGMLLLLTNLETRLKACQAHQHKTDAEIETWLWAEGYISRPEYDAKMEDGEP